jgi:hypothetical protein
MIARLFLHIIILLMAWFPVSGFALPVTSSIAPGLNLTGVPAALVAGQQTAIPLLTLWKPLGVTAIESYDVINGKMLRAELDGSENPVGVDFPLIENSALYVYSTQQNTFSLGNSTSCAPLNLVAGFNLVSHSCFPTNFTASQFIDSVGIANITSLSRLDLQSGRWQIAAVDGGMIVGDDFTLVAGEGYIIQAAAVTSGWASPKLVLTPATLTVQQGQQGIALAVAIPGAAPLGGMIIDIVSSDPALVNVTTSVTIPPGATSVAVPLTLPDTGSVTAQSVTITATHTGWWSDQTTVTVRPKPTVNLVPTTTLTGLGYTYFLTVSLTEAAPAGGMTVSLTSSPAGIVSPPTSVFIPEGSLSTQATVTALALGTAVISPAAPDLAFTGSTNTVTVNPIRTVGIGPTVSAQVGVVVSEHAPPPLQATYASLSSNAVGVVVGEAISSVAPKSGSIGTTELVVRVNGAGLAGATGMSFVPPDGITVRTASFTAAADGSYCEVTIDIAADAPVSERTVLLAGVAAYPASPAANLFRVTFPAPQLLSLIPDFGVTGTNFILQVNGRNLQQPTAVTFVPPDGISVANPPTVSGDGSLASVRIFISPSAQLGARVVRITTPAGETSGILTAADSFDVRSVAGSTTTPVLSPLIGVSVLASSAPAPLATYTPTSAPVGVAVGSTVTSVSPRIGFTGTTAVVVRVNGYGFAGATGISFVPADGIAVQPATFNVALDGTYSEVTVDIQSGAPLTERTVVLQGITAYPASAGANLFRITLPPPEVYGISPIRMPIGTTFTLTMTGRYLSYAESVDFSPADGITVVNPPLVSSDGTLASVTVRIAADAPTASRTVTIRTPGGTSSGAQSAANTFTVTADSGSTYTPVISPSVGVSVGGVALPGTTSTYSPVSALPVGVAVGPTITAVVPRSGFVAQAGLVVRVNGSGLSGATGLSFVPSDGITPQSGTFNVAADGSYCEITVDIAPNAPLSERSINVDGITSYPATAAANLFRVTLPVPEVLGLSPIRKETGATFILTMRGTNLSYAGSIDFLPSAGITVVNPPAVTSDGTVATVEIRIAANAPTGNRVVTISTAGGTSSSTASAANTFVVTTDVGTTYMPVVSPVLGVTVSAPAQAIGPSSYNLISQPVGIMVGSAPPPPATYDAGPVLSPPLGVSVGAVITAIIPNVIQPGTTSVITIQGAGLDQTNSVLFQPSTGITVGTVTPSPDGATLTLSITADSTVPIGAKSVFLFTPSGPVPPASAGVNLLMVGPKPVITSIVPIQEVAGNTFTLVIHGHNLAGVSRVTISPADDIQVSSTPVYYTDAQGEHVAVTVVLGSTAVGGERTVALFTPYGSTDPAATAANTFTVIQPLAANAAAPNGTGTTISDEVRLAADQPPPGDRKIDPAGVMMVSGITTGAGREKRLAPRDISIKSAMIPSWAPSGDPPQRAADGRDYYFRFAGYRGPPDLLRRIA